MKRTYWYAVMIHPVESALPSRVARIQQGGDEVSAATGRITFYEAVKLSLEIIQIRSIFKPGCEGQGKA